jgi:hypothetical protein
VLAVEPKAELYLFGSGARGDAGFDPDWDILLLVDGQVNLDREIRIWDQMANLQFDHPRSPVGDRPGGEPDRLGSQPPLRTPALGDNGGSPIVLTRDALDIEQAEHCLPRSQQFFESAFVNLDVERMQLLSATSTFCVFNAANAALPSRGIAACSHAAQTSPWGESS